MHSTRWLVLGLLIAGCGDDTTPTGTPDAPSSIDAPRTIDAPMIDAPAIDAPANAEGGMADAMADAELDAMTVCFGTTASCGQNPAACTDCTGNAGGSACINNMTCGCNAAADCPVGRACDSTTHLCTTTCDPTTQPCNGGCCATGSCQLGNQIGQCGNDGTQCLQCGTQASGHLCVPTTNGGFCGCDSNSDCAGGTCNTTTHLCN
jgi:hypothetical protein